MILENIEKQTTEASVATQGSTPNAVGSNRYVGLRSPPGFNFERPGLSPPYLYIHGYSPADDRANAAGSSPAGVAPNHAPNEWINKYNKNKVVAPETQHRATPSTLRPFGVWCGASFLRPALGVGQGLRPWTISPCWSFV